MSAPGVCLQPFNSRCAPKVLDSPAKSRHALKRWRLPLLALVAAACFGCSTYYDPYDDYTRGVRWFDGRDFDLARAPWEPLAKSGG